MHRKSPVVFTLAGTTLLAALLAPRDAAAVSTIKDPNPPDYHLELEPKLNITPGGFFDYGGLGIGPGIRATIPVMSPGFVKTINDSIGISFGLDILHYDGYRYYARCGRNGCPYYDAGNFWSIYFPVAMQWNFWLTDRWSVFGEPGLALRHAFYSGNYCDNALYDCNSRDTLYFLFYAGGRFAFNDHMALTMRIGHPTLLSVGLSFFF